MLEIICYRQGRECMPSNARSKLAKSLLDVDELINAHPALTGGGAGRPAGRQGEALCRAGIVMSVACTEAFFEDLFEEAAPLLFASASTTDLKFLFEGTTKKLNHPAIHKLRLLYWNLGVIDVFSGVSWQKSDNAKLIKSYNLLLDLRGRIAHGRQPKVKLSLLKYYRGFIEKLGEKIEKKVVNHIQSATNKPPAW